VADAALHRCGSAEDLADRLCNRLGSVNHEQVSITLPSMLEGDSTTSSRIAAGRSSRPRVLVVTPDFPPPKGGIQAVVVGLVSNWHRVVSRVVAPAGRESDDVARRHAIDLSRTARLPDTLGRRFSLLWLNAAALAAAVRYRPEVILSIHIVTSPAAWVAGRVLGVPYVQYGHGDELVAHPRLARFAFDHAAAGVVVSAHSESLVASCGASTKRLHRIPPGIDLAPDINPQGQGSQVRDRRPTIITVARMEDFYKGHDVMIRALPQVRSRVPGVLWVVIGDGRLRPSYERMVKEAGLAENVRFCGVLPDEERDHWLTRATVFAMPSRVDQGRGGEGFGIVYLEAGARGLPVVAGSCGGALDAVEDGKTGLLVDPSDETAVARALVELLEDRALALRMGLQSARRARDYVWPRVAEKVEELLIHEAHPV
jgi:phosphatidyl-myo-inositol dimannoside synthase